MPSRPVEEREALGDPPRRTEGGGLCQRRSLSTCGHGPSSPALGSGLCPCDIPGEWQPGKVRQGMATQCPASPAPGPPLRFVPAVGSLKKNFVRSLQGSLFVFQPAGLTFLTGPRALCWGPAGRAGGEGPWPGVRGPRLSPPHSLAVPRSRKSHDSFLLPGSVRWDLAGTAGRAGVFRG